MSTKRREPEIVYFEERRKRGNREQEPSDTLEKTTVEKDTKTNEFDLKKARYEVMKFGISGFEEEKRLIDKIALAVMLRAKPPKREYKNYKVLMEERKKNKETQKQQQSGSQMSVQLTNRKKQKNASKKKKKM